MYLDDSEPFADVGEMLSAMAHPAYQSDSLYRQYVSMRTSRMIAKHGHDSLKSAVDAINRSGSVN
jgi:hypothetical protein